VRYVDRVLVKMALLHMLLSFSAMTIVVVSGAYGVQYADTVAYKQDDRSYGRIQQIYSRC